MTGGELTLGAVLARLEEREREITAQAETTREQITQLTAQLDELGRAAEEVRITRKTLLALPDPQPPAPAGTETAGPSGLPSRSWRCSPRPTGRCVRGRCARRWTWR
ncbi:hypothetical protein [Streptomyces graminilatus]|uniref:hypothetical protein n=1 Tax=Streptomyces graminilatus TaxID=1464070 RepID=UPI000B055B44|nr:hypothetical protein [Streptomyces graminilatus]